MRLKRAKQYVEKALPVLVEHIREKYFPGFVAPGIEFNNDWLIHCLGRYRSKIWGDLKAKVILTRPGRICEVTVANTLAHELGHALLDQMNPKFYYAKFYFDGYYNRLDEGIADVLAKEGKIALNKKGLYPYSVLNKLRVDLNVYLSPRYWLWRLKKRKPSLGIQGKKLIEKLKEKGTSLVDIMKQAHDPKFVHSIFQNGV